MIRGLIFIQLNDGTLYTYANKYLYDKTVGGTVKDDGATPANLLYNGHAGLNYCYTGYGNDTYDKQTELGEIKADFEFLSKQLSQDGDEFLLFPEGDNKHAGSAILERSSVSPVSLTPAVSRTKIQIGKISTITVNEKWIEYPDSNNRESGYTLPKSSPNFHGFNEYAELTEEEMGGPHHHDFISYDMIRESTTGVEEPDIDIDIDTGDTADPVTLSISGTYKASQYFKDNNISFECSFIDQMISPTEMTKEVKIVLNNADTKTHTFFTSANSTVKTVAAGNSETVYDYVTTPADNPITITVDGTSVYNVKFNSFISMTITEE